MYADEICAKLKELAPFVAFLVATSDDPDARWDGDGPNPEEEGWEPKQVDVIASTVYQGNVLTGEAHMCGHYVHPDHPDLDLGGYLPQMLEEAANELAEQIRSETPQRKQLRAVHAFLKQEMRERYNAQRAEIEAERRKG